MPTKPSIVFAHGLWADGSCAKQDHTVSPELQRSAAKRMGATTVGVDSSHVPMLSKPGVVLDAIRAAAKAVAAKA